MPNSDVLPLFDAAAKLNVGFYLGYAELVLQKGKKQRFNTSVIVNGAGQVVGKYRKIHMPRHFEHEPRRPIQHLAKLYFDSGHLGFPVLAFFGGKIGMCLCIDLLRSASFRVKWLRGPELVML